MRKLLAIAFAVVACMVALPNTAEARGRGYINVSFVSGHARCGCPIYSQRVLSGYDYYGRPVYQVVRRPFRCGGGCGRRVNVRYRDHGFVNARQARRYYNRSDRGYYRNDNRRRGRRGYRNCR